MSLLKGRVCTAALMAMWPQEMWWNYLVSEPFVWKMTYSPQCLSLSILTRGKAWQNWVTWYDVPGHVEEWHLPGKTASKRVRYRSWTWTVERSVVLRSVLAIGSTLAYLLFLWECATPPHVQVRHTTWLSFTRPSPAWVLQATNAGARRPGYEATTGPHQHITIPTLIRVLNKWVDRGAMLYKWKALKCKPCLCLWNCVHNSMCPTGLYTEERGTLGLKSEVGPLWPWHLRSQPISYISTKCIII